MSEELERVYTINLGKVLLSQSQHRSVRALNMIREFARKHMKTQNIKIEEDLARQVWSRGARSPPRKIRVRMKKTDVGDILVSKYDGPLELDDSSDDSESPAVEGAAATAAITSSTPAAGSAAEVPSLPGPDSAADSPDADKKDDSSDAAAKDEIIDAGPNTVETPDTLQNAKDDSDVPDGVTSDATETGDESATTFDRSDAAKNDTDASSSEPSDDPGHPDNAPPAESK